MSQKTKLMKSLAACIIETRTNVDIISVLDRHFKYLPEDTELFIMTPHKDTVLKKYKTVTFINDIEIRNIYDYNRLLTDPYFWVRFFSFDRVLIFQHDSGILRPGIEEFFPYDYVGAAWNWNQNHGGNGGISLRNPRTMFRIAAQKLWDMNPINEDVFFCNELYATNKYDSPLGLAPINICNLWGTETIHQLGTLTYHAIDKYQTRAQVQKIMEQYTKIPTE